MCIRDRYQSGLKAAFAGGGLDLSPEGLGANMTEAEASFSEAGQSLKEKLLEKFKVVPEGFLDVGKDAAENFSSAFLDGLNKIMERAGAVLTAGIQPAYAASGAGAGNVQNISNAVSYNLYGSGETVAQQLQSARAHRQIEKLRGNL